MIHVLEGGTDAASMILFDPDSLPDDFDDRAREDPAAAIEAAAAAGRLCKLEPGSDGSYTLGVCVGEGPPAGLAGFLRPLSEADRFLVVGGRLHFAGIEGVSRQGAPSTAESSQGGDSVAIPPGVYRLRVQEADYSDEFLEGRMRERTSAAGLRLLAIMNRRLLPLGTFGTLAGFVSLLILGWRDWRVTALPLCLAMVLPAIVVSRLRSYREARDAGRELSRDLPDYWAVLEPIEPA
ncbi:hypothetical protein [Paludisphaera soli]|uniref:hypothetical protein n=1 Tax=Paludisphaera soli TaxID=2712865 RepID=UPI0013EDBD38|nr:hypothetical protein [Paludisphaera soli]